VRFSAFFAFTVLLSGPAFADDETTDLARRHYQSGSAYFEESRYDDAIREFRDSYRLAPRVELLFNVARCFHRKGDAARAVEAYAEYLQGNPKTPDRASIEKDIAELKKKVGALRVTDAPAGSEIFVDGYSVGKAPLPGTVTGTVGSRLVEARVGEGKAPLRVLVDVRAGGETLAKIPPPEREIVIQEKVVHVVDNGPRWYTSKPGWAVAGGGAVVAIVGAALLGRARPTQDAASTAKSENDWQSQQDLAHNLQNAGIGLLAGGVALVAVGTVFFVLRGRSSDAPRTAWVAPTGNGLALGGSW
jgi:tetratricopeptide (TPR) repeat protein